jgi:hypothetical protein
MRLSGIFALTGIAVLSTAFAARAEEGYRLDLEGPAMLHAALGATARGTCSVTLEPPSAGGEAEGWSFAVSATDARIVGITVEGTAGEGAWAGGFERSEIVSGPEGGGAVSTVILPAGGPLVLPPFRRRSIAAIEVETVIVDFGADFPQGATLWFPEELPGSAGPVKNTVLEDGSEVVPSFEDSTLRIERWPTERCSDVSVGFSTDNLYTPVPFAGIIGGEAGSGELRVPVDRGETGKSMVYVDLAKSAGDYGVQGFSLSVALDGDAHLVDVTYAGTAIEKIFGRGSFLFLEIVDPDMNHGQQGAVMSAVGFCKKPCPFPPLGTYSLMRLSVESQGPQAFEDFLAGLRFKDGLVGTGEPVPNCVTVEGVSFRACNTFDASLAIRFQLYSSPFFVRGNANGDGRVDISDAIWIFYELFLGGPKTTCRDAADSNNDARIDISDPVFILNHLLHEGRPPPSPYPDCGTDPDGAADGMVCVDPQPLCH